MLRHYKVHFLLVVLAGLALGVYGCGEISPTATVTDGSAALPSEFPGRGLMAEAVPSADGVDCGTVCVEKDKDSWSWVFYDQDQPEVLSYFIILPGAIDENTSISIKVTKEMYQDDRSGQWSYRALFDFAPDGLVFRRKAELHIDARWLDLKEDEKVVLRYYNQDENLWEEVKTNKVHKGMVEFKIAHFSKYAISR